MMRWFGRAYGTPYEAECPHAPTPVGRNCDWCDEPFLEADDGVLLPLLGEPEKPDVAYHYACHLRQVIGGANHLRGRCTCCGGKEPPDPPWLTRKQAAQEALDVWQQRQAR